MSSAHSTDAEHDGHARAQPAHPHHQPHSARALPRVLLTPEKAAQALGISRSKLYELRWADVNMTTRSLHLVKQLKTKSSRRQVLLPRIAAEALTTHRARQAVERTHAGTAWEDHGLVFTNTLGGPLHPRNFLLRDFYPLLGRAGLPQMRFHDLGHSAARLLLELGIHPKVVREMLGHSQIGITLDLYSHVTVTMQQQAVTALDDLFHEL